MARPKPRILMESPGSRNSKAIAVLEATTVYAIFYDGRPINLLQRSLSSNVISYKKTGFVNPGHAFNSAEKLNKLFRTDKFVVMKMTKGQIIKDIKLNTKELRS